MAVRAPKLEGKRWYNSAPLSPEALKGRVVVLDFFTYGCINCLNNIETIKALHRSYGEQLTIVGVHSGKFDREKEGASLASALERLGIAYAVVDDADHRLLEQYAVKAWPTTVVIDCRGYIVKTMTGERRLMDFKETLEGLGVTDTSEQRVASSAGERLRFPQKLCCGEEVLAVSNTGGDSVWLCGYDGEVLRRFEGIDRPMGVVFDGAMLFVAESGSGNVLRIDTKSGELESVLSGLRTPYDLAVAENILFVAQAGSHQITAYELEGFGCVATWGNRFEALRDGAFEGAQLAQPSGLSVLHDQLWFVDAESSALRVIEGESVRTVVGEGLHTFGDSDETPILMQHPQGVVAGQYGDGCGGGRIFIADTYNDKVKVFNPDDGSMMTLLDTLHAPGGIAKKGARSTSPTATPTASSLSTCPRWRSRFFSSFGLRIDVVTLLQQDTRKILSMKELEQLWLGYLDDLDIAFQPIVSIHTGKLYGVEALLRGVQEIGFHSIDAFFDRAYIAGVLYTLDLALREKVFKKFTAIENYNNIKLFINLDNRLLEMSNFSTGNTERLLKKYQLLKEMICFEISERHEIVDPQVFEEILNHYKQGYYSIAIDDFGVGVSGFKMLYRSTPDIIKIDRFFLGSIPTDLKKRFLYAASSNWQRSSGLR